MTEEKLLIALVGGTAGDRPAGRMVGRCCRAGGVGAMTVQERAMLELPTKLADGTAGHRSGAVGLRHGR